MNLHEMLTKTAEAENFYLHALANARENAAKVARHVAICETDWAIACNRLERLEVTEGVYPEVLEEAQKDETEAYKAMNKAEETFLAADHVVSQCKEAYEAARRFYAALQAFK